MSSTSWLARGDDWRTRMKEMDWELVREEARAIIKAGGLAINVHNVLVDLLDLELYARVGRDSARDYCAKNHGPKVARTKEMGS